jgi:hypothetical protein
MVPATSWVRFFDGYPFSRIEWLAHAADLDLDRLHA